MYTKSEHPEVILFGIMASRTNRQTNKQTLVKITHTHTHTDVGQVTMVTKTKDVVAR